MQNKTNKILDVIVYVSELSCMELGTGLGQNWDGTGT